MASIYQRENSPYYWLKFRNPITGKIERVSTRYRVGIGSERRKAEQLAAEKAIAEVASKQLSGREMFAVWVPGWLDLKYADKPRTHTRLKIVWYNLSGYFHIIGITHPRQITRTHCLDYIGWRAHPPIGYKSVGRNTAIYELNILRLLMREAIARGYAETNPASKLGIPKLAVREKAEFTDADFKLIESKIESQPEQHRTFLRVSFLIARYQGCRLRETALNPTTDVDLTGMTIRFIQKGNRVHVAPLHPALVPLFTSLQGQTETYPPVKHPSSVWSRFLWVIGLRQQGKCFHSLRVTAASRLARSGKVKEIAAMRFLGHASTLVHRAYVRLRHEDLAACVDALT